MTKSRKYRILALAAGLAAVAGATIHASHNDFGLGRNMEITVNMMRELSLGYVDPIDPDRLMEGAAAGMVSDLDPYTEYISEEGMSDFELLTTGKYGGVGALIRKKGDWVVIAQPYQGTPSDRAGLRIGDRILEIDGRDARGFTTEEVSSRLKGEPGSRVKVTVLHLDSTRQTVTLRRERIAIPGVPYAGWAADGIGYIRHSDFTEGCYEEMRAAVERLRAEGGLKGLILDYRSNGGGIMQEAVKILSMFVPKGTAVVTTKGRNERQDYRTESEPILPDLPLAVLVNGNTASASEIVAGALQDLDRAVLIGQRSFGKGLVQTTRPLGYNTMLKLTTAKYYIPSGRCIQAIDYSHSQEGSVRVVPDSLVSEFTTRAGRKVYDGGGIMPDVFVPQDTTGVSSYLIEVGNKGLIIQFSFQYTDRNRAKLSTFENEQDLLKYLRHQGIVEQFIRFADSKGVKRRNLLIHRSYKLLERNLYGNIIYNTLGKEAYIRYVNESDATVKKALEILERDEAFPKAPLQAGQEEENADGKEKRTAQAYGFVEDPSQIYHYASVAVC